MAKGYHSFHDKSGPHNRQRKLSLKTKNWDNRLMRLRHFDLVSLLPEELSIQVLSFLPVKTLCTCQLVCKRWRNLANDAVIWKRKCLELTCYDLNPLVPPPSPALWYPLYKRLFRRESNWDGGRVQTINYFRGHQSQIFSVVIKEGMAVSLAVDRSLRYWDVEKGVCLSVLTLAHVAEEVALLPKESVLAVSFRTEFIHVYELCEGNSKITLTSSARTSLHCVNLGDEYAVAGSDEGTIYVWNWRTRVLVACLENKQEILYVQVGPSNTIVSLHTDGKVKVFSLNDNKLLYSYTFLNLAVDDTVVSATISQQWLLCATRDLIYLLEWRLLSPRTTDVDFSRPPVVSWEMDAPGVVPWCGCLANSGRAIISNCSSSGPICVVKPGGGVRFLTAPGTKLGGCRAIVGGNGIKSKKEGGWKLLNLDEQPTFMDVDDRFLVIGTRQGSVIRCGFELGL